MSFCITASLCNSRSASAAIQRADLLREARERYYDHNRFADAFTHLKRAPNSLAARIAALEAKGLAGCARFVGGCVRNTVLGREVGNALEVAETVAYLTGDGPREPRLHEVTMALAAEMLFLGKLAADAGEGRVKAEAALADGRAAEAAGVVWACAKGIAITAVQAHKIARRGTIT